MQLETAIKSVVLIGYIGSGKTTIFNKCCNKNQKVEAGGKSVTRQTFMTESAYGNGFRMLDTPGFGSSTDKIGHAVGILNALAEGPISQIIMIVKFERLDLMDMFLKPMIQNQFRRFKKMITVLVTFWDDAEKGGKNKEQERYLEIKGLLQKYGVNSIIFSSINQNGDYLCSQIDQVLLNAKNEKVEITETEFYSYFDLIEVEEHIEDELRDEKEKIRVQFKKKTNIIKKFIGGFDQNNPIMTELMHALTIEIKKLANLAIEQFQKDNNTKFSRLYELYNEAKVAYLIDTQLKLELMEEVQQIVKLTQIRLKNYTGHCFNYVKRCPHCGEVWIKVSGCNGKTQCGNFPDKDELQSSPPLAFKFVITETDIRYEQTSKGFPSKLKTNYQFPDQNKIGCGETFDWSQQPLLDTNQLDELLDPGLLDYLAKEIPKDIEKTMKQKLHQEIQFRKQDLVVVKL